MGRDLQVVLKIAERCNINCTYCYYFNHGDDGPYQRAPYISTDVVQGIVRFADLSTQLLDIGRINIVLHGGEPLMIGKRRFRALCSEMMRINGPVKLSLTTNGMLIDPEWIDIFSEYKIGMAVSIDGPKEYHDRERIDFQGRGTYDRVVEGIKLLRAAADAGGISEPSALATIDIRSRGDVVYNHLVRELGFKKSLDFLIPQLLHDTNPSPSTINAVGRYLIEAFDEWIADDDPQIHVRGFLKYMDHLLGRTNAADENPDFIIVAVTSTGDITNDDYMMEIKPPLFTAKLNVMRDDVTDYLSALKEGVLGEVSAPHEECVRCQWYKVCRPQTLPYAGAEFRFRRSNGFKNKHVFCEAFQSLFGAMTNYIRASTIQSKSDAA